MKRSKLFLALTSGFLTIVGIVAAKLSYRHPLVTVYYCTALGRCQPLGTKLNVTATYFSNAILAKAQFGMDTYTLYTKITTNLGCNCKNPAYGLLDPF